MAGNTKDGTIRSTLHQDQMYLSGLPKKIQHFILNDAIGNYNTLSVYKIYRKNGAARAYDSLVLHTVKRAIEAYGPDHPCVERLKSMKGSY